MTVMPGVLVGVQGGGRVGEARLQIPAGRRPGRLRGVLGKGLLHGARGCLQTNIARRVAWQAVMMLPAALHAPQAGQQPRHPGRREHALTGDNVGRLAHANAQQQRHEQHHACADRAAAHEACEWQRLELLAASRPTARAVGAAARRLAGGGGAARMERAVVEASLPYGDPQADPRLGCQRSGHRLPCPPTGAHPGPAQHGIAWGSMPAPWAAGQRTQRMQPCDKQATHSTCQQAWVSACVARRRRDAVQLGPPLIQPSQQAEQAAGMCGSAASPQPHLQVDERRKVG